MAGKIGQDVTVVGEHDGDVGDRSTVISDLNALRPGLTAGYRARGSRHTTTVGSEAHSVAADPIEALARLIEKTGDKDLRILSGDLQLELAKSNPNQHKVEGLWSKIEKSDTIASLGANSIAIVMAAKEFIASIFS